MFDPTPGHFPVDHDSDSSDAGDALARVFLIPASSPNHKCSPSSTPPGSPKSAVHSPDPDPFLGDPPVIDPAVPAAHPFVPPPPPPYSIMGDVDALKNAMKDVFKDICGVSVPLPQFHGKKGGKSEQHCLKVEDYFKDLKITENAEKKAKFKATLCGKARQWLEDLPEPDNYTVADAATAVEKAAALKHKFIERWSTKGKTLDALYSEWQNLKFDPTTDDIDEFISDVKNLAKYLGYPERAQVMAIRDSRPMEVFTMCHSIDNLNELRANLIKVFDHPKVKKNYVSASGVTPAPTAFSMTRYQEEDGPSTAMSDDVGKLMSKFDSLEYSIRKMSVANPRHRQQKYKPEVTPSSSKEVVNLEEEVVDNTANRIIGSTHIVGSTANRIIDPTHIIQGTPISIEIIIEVEEEENLIKVLV